MPAFTPNLNLYKPGGGSTGTIVPDEVVDIDRLNQNSDIIDAAVKTLQDKTSVLELTRGLVGIKPGSVTVTSGTVAVDDDGDITFSGLTANTFINIDGAFSSLYSRYRVLFQATAPADGGFSTQMRASNAPNTAASYRYGIMRSGGASASGVSNTDFPWANASGTDFACIMEFSNPAQAAPTRFRLDSGYSNGAGTSMEVSSMAGIHAVAAAFDGFNIKPAFSGPWQGSLKIYAYA